MSTYRTREGFPPKSVLLRVEFVTRCGFQAQGVAKQLLVAGVWTEWGSAGLGPMNVRDGPKDDLIQ